MDAVGKGAQAQEGDLGVGQGGAQGALDGMVLPQARAQQQIVGAAAHIGMGQDHFRVGGLAFDAEQGETAAHVVIHLGIVGPKAGAGGVDGQAVGDASVLQQPAFGIHAPDRQLIAKGQRVVEVDGAIEAAASHFVPAVVVEGQAAGNGGFLHLHYQVRRAELGAGLEYGPGGEAGHVVQQEQAALQRAHGKRFFIGHGLQAGSQELGGITPVAFHGDLAGRAFDDLDADHAAFDLLGGDDGPTQGMAVLAVVFSNQFGDLLEIEQVEGLAGLTGNESLKLSIGENRVADKTEGIDGKALGVRIGFLSDFPGSQQYFRY